MLILLLLAATTVEAAKIRITVESPGGIEQYIHLSRPVNLAPDRPVVFVMHGMKRNADEYRDQWHDLADKHDFLLVVANVGAETDVLCHEDDVRLGRLDVFERKQLVAEDYEQAFPCVRHALSEAGYWRR